LILILRRDDYGSLGAGMKNYINQARNNNNKKKTVIGVAQVTEDFLLYEWTTGRPG